MLSNLRSLCLRTKNVQKGPAQNCADPTRMEVSPKLGTPPISQTGAEKTNRSNRFPKKFINGSLKTGMLEFLHKLEKNIIIIAERRWFCAIYRIFAEQQSHASGSRRGGRGSECLTKNRIPIYPYVDPDKITTMFLFATSPLLSQSGNTKSSIKGNTLNSDSLNRKSPCSSSLYKRRHCLPSITSQTRLLLFNKCLWLHRQKIKSHHSSARSAINLASLTASAS